MQESKRFKLLLLQAWPEGEEGALGRVALEPQLIDLQTLGCRCCPPGTCGLWAALAMATLANLHKAELLYSNAGH